MIVEAFVQMRRAVTIQAELTERVDELERRLGKHSAAIAAILSAIRRLGQTDRIQAELQDGSRH